MRAAIILSLLASLSFGADSSRFDTHFSEVGSHFNIPPTLLKKIAKIESDLNPKCVGINKNRTVDYGLMQINSCHFGELKKYGINENNIMNPKVNITAAAILLKKYIGDDNFALFEIGKYHSHTHKFKAIWNDRLAREIVKEL